MTSILAFHAYRYFPYEKVLALREAAQLLGAKVICERQDSVEIHGVAFPEQAKRLAYFASAHHGRDALETLQSQLERVAAVGRNRQSTRYSVHGLHEYKGKFNPQIVKAILNIFNVNQGDRILDPFCGSGTTLIECAHIGAQSVGFDLNPFAVYLANAKLQALGVPANKLFPIVSKLKTSLARTRRAREKATPSDRGEYLGGWFTPENLQSIEAVRIRIEEHAGEFAPIFLSVASNLLRDYSLQDPNDLRIRRRKTPLPTIPFADAFIDAALNFLIRLQDAQLILGVQAIKGEALLHDTTAGGQTKKNRNFDAAVTSPPYAMALPYIDTQRLSLVWLNLIPATEILRLESNLVGSREVRGTSRRELDEQLAVNYANLPEAELNFCARLASSLGPSDGFRRQAVSGLLYRYFAAMQASFAAVHKQLKRGAPYALVVGHNHTVLGGKRFDINTPAHLAALAKQSGWIVDEMIPLQTYQRYGYHMDNAVAAETLLLLRRP